MEGSRLPPTKGTILQAIQEPTPSRATPAATTHDAKHDVGGSTQPNEQHAMDKPHESVATTGQQGVLTIRGDG